jgi:hypothetical protein
MSMRLIRTVLVSSAFALLLGQSAQAQDSSANQASVDANAFAVASATSYAPIPAGALLDVSTADSRELASNAVDLTSGTLEQHGYKISRDAPYAVDVTAVLVRGIGQDQGVSSPSQGSVRGDEYTNADQLPSGDLTQGNLFDNSRGALLTPQEVSQTGHLLRVSLSVYDRKSGLYVWRGQVERDTVNVDVDSSMQQMVPALLAHFGQSMPQTEVPLH